MCFITPTFRRDLAQFTLLRKTIQVFAPEIPHLVIVDDEDLALFTETFRDQVGDLLTFRSSREVLPPAVERGRHLLKRYGRFKSFLRRNPWGAILSPGWKAQQLMKIYALAGSGCDFAVFLDSDVFLCGEVTAGFFLRDGLPRLFEGPADDAEKMAFDVSTHLILCNRLYSVKKLYDYIFSPTVFRRSTATRLLEHLSRQKFRTWVRKFHDVYAPSEYNLLGYAARVLENYEGYSLDRCSPADMHYSIRYPEDVARMMGSVEALGAGDGNARKFFLLQSSLDLGEGGLDGVMERCEARLLAG